MFDDEPLDKRNDIVPINRELLDYLREEFAKLHERIAALERQFRALAR